MKVLQINSVCGIGSTGRIATDINNMLIEQDNEGVIAFGREQPIGCESYIKIGEKIDNYAHVIKTRILDKHGFGSKKATQIFIEKIEKMNPDVIHLHNIHGYYINIEILFNYLKLAKKPVIWTLHDCWAFTGHCAHFEHVQCEKWIDGCYECPQTNEYPRSFFIDNSENNYEKKKELFNGVDNLTIVTPSRWLANLVKKSFLGDYPVKVINNGIDTKIFRKTKSNLRSKYKLDKKFIILGVASHWTTKKGFNTFIELSRKIKTDEAIIMVGLTKDMIKKIPGNIIAIEKTNNIKELAELFSIADVFLNPTLEDNYPTVNLESIACGTPVISFNSGGSSETFSPQEGILTKYKSVSSILEALKEIKNKPPEISRSLNIDKNTKYKEYLDLYMRLIEDRFKDNGRSSEVQR